MIGVTPPLVPTKAPAGITTDPLKVHVSDADVQNVNPTLHCNALVGASVVNESDGRATVRPTSKAISVGAAAFAASPPPRRLSVRNVGNQYIDGAFMVE